MAVGAVRWGEAPLLHYFNRLLVQSRPQLLHHRNVVGSSIDVDHRLDYDYALDSILSRLVRVIRHRTIEASRLSDTVDAGLRELGINRLCLGRARDRDK